MDYVLWLYSVAVLLLVLAAVVVARRLVEPLYAPLPASVEPMYREGSPSWKAQQARRQGAVRAALVTQASFVPVAVEWPHADEPSVIEVEEQIAELERQLARVTAAEVETETLVHWPAPPTIVHGEIEEAGAEHWGDLLRDMSTEERTIYDLEMVATHEALKAPERALQSELDRTVARALAELERENEAAERRAQYWETTAARRGSFEDAPTGAYPMLATSR